MILRGLKITIGLIHNWVYRSSFHAVSGWQGVHVRQRYSVAPAPKLSGTEKLLPCHRLTPMIYYHHHHYYYYYIYVF